MDKGFGPVVSKFEFGKYWKQYGLDTFTGQSIALPRGIIIKL